MNYNDLIAYLDIEDGSELRYFEEMADLIESDEHIDSDALFRLFENLETDTAAGLMDEYFNDISGGLPGEYSELFTLLEQIRLELTGLVRSISKDDPESVSRFTDRFCRFRNWYVYDAEVSVLERTYSDAGNAGSAREYEQSVRDAIAAARAGRFSGEEFAFDFSAALDYDIDYYEMSFADLIDAADIQDDND